MSANRSRIGLKQLGLVGLAAATVLISALHDFTDPAHLPWHNLFQVLYYIPIVVGALLFGWRAGLCIGVIAAISHSPYIAKAARVSPDDAAEQIVEMLLLCAVGLLTGILSDRDRKQRLELQRTTHELSDVYQELQQNFEQMKRAERLFAVGQLAAGLAHEIRNPLWSVAGAAGILQRNARLEPKHQECVEIIQKESQRLNRLLTEFLDFARPRPPNFQRIEVEGLLTSVVQLAAHAVGRKPVELRTEAAPGLPQVEGDSEMVKQMLLNLLINAIQAMPEGGEVLLAAEALEGRIRIRVCDEGCGIDAENRDKIFDPFFTTKDGGTGLGLAVAHQIVEQHGGMLKAEANPNGGMTFSVLLPLRQEVAR